MPMQVPAILEVGNIRHHLLDDGRVAKWAAFRAKCLAPGTEYTFQVKVSLWTAQRRTSQALTH